MYNLYERSSMTINYQFPFYPYNNYQQPTCGGYGFQPTITNKTLIVDSKIHI